ncbi:MAG TPA: hypothetical protein VF861_05540 [Telluria sp.]
MNDFDFLRGRWQVANHRLKKRLQNNDEWEAFDAHASNQALPAGIGNYDDFLVGSWRPGYVGLSLRLFNPQTGNWSIYWLDNQTGGLDANGLLLNPVVGRFENGIGIFEGDDVLDGRPIRVRYTWCDIGPDSARWEQAMSGDGGQHWEMNWRMVFRRMADRP